MRIDRNPSRRHTYGGTVRRKPKSGKVLTGLIIAGIAGLTFINRDTIRDGLVEDPIQTIDTVVAYEPIEKPDTVMGVDYETIQEKLTEPSEKVKKIKLPEHVLELNSHEMIRMYFVNGIMPPVRNKKAINRNDMNNREREICIKQ